jgi:hypothetical protein
MSKFISKTEVQTKIDADGNEQITKVESSTAITRNDEPDYIKIYTNMWAEFNGIPLAYRELFLQLAIRMTYCNSDDLKDAQLVYTGKPFSESIMVTLNWKVDMYKRGLRELTKAGAIVRIARGVYQINPQYAGKGEWKYNPKLKRGGIQDLIATFNYREKTVEATMIWADDGKDNELNGVYREGLRVSKNAETTIIETKIRNITIENLLEDDNLNN